MNRKTKTIPKQEVIPQNKQKLSLRQVVRIIAKEQAKKFINKNKIIQYRDNLEKLEDILFMDNLEHLNSYIDDENFICLPFLYSEEEKLINNSSLFLVDWVHECGFKTKIELYETDIKEHLLSFTPEQREHCYIVSHGRIQDFMVDGDKLILEEILVVEDTIPEQAESLLNH